MALPIMRSRWHEDLTEGEARALLEDALRVLFYRDCRALNRIQIAKVRPTKLALLVTSDKRIDVL